MSHTPGPWTADPTTGYIASKSHGYVPLVTPFREGVHKDKHGGATPEALANAHLIAAAPELLGACQRLLECPELNSNGGLDEFEPETRQAIKLGAKAIAKAEGRT